MQSLEAALDLASRGFWVFPLGIGVKTPAVMGWQEAATKDEARIRQCWKGAKGHNVGIYTGMFGDEGEALLVVDVDNKNGLEGSCAWHEMLRQYGSPATAIARTPSGGFHWFFTVPEAMAQGVNTLGPGLDTRSRGGYVVGAGSYLPGAGRYEWVQKPGLYVPKPRIAAIVK